MKTDVIAVEGRRYTVNYFKMITRRGVQRYCSELMLGPGDRIIVDGRSLGDLEWRVARLIPATVDSRMLARSDAA